MRMGGRRVLSLLAIYAIALHTILWGAATPLIAGSSGRSVLGHLP